MMSYLRNTSKRRTAFETNRIATIRKHADINQWHWVDTHNNPADLYSRGVSPKQLHKAEKWLKAPEFLLKDESLWPSLVGTTSTANPLEVSLVIQNDASTIRDCARALVTQVSSSDNLHVVPTVLV